ncbi:MAG TPA: tellurite resistance/C4-dicarboxylate transporter family protein [Spirochaetia bacterium]|nr:tellurite resistance/C4-dicarboxylate transporter family protein [Spirochaetia bacterium]
MKLPSADFYPGSFALVMATGIISTAAFLLSFLVLARILLFANILFYAALWLMTLRRLIVSFPRLRADLRGHATGAGFFTTVAGTCVLGTQIALVTGDYAVAMVLWILGLFLWLLLTYAFLGAVITSRTKPDFGAAINGGWLVAVVATQSISVLATVLSPGYPASSEALLFLSLCFCLAGGMLYIIIMTLLFYRLVFFALAPGDLSPLSWVSMGAAAITTLSGARLVLSAGEWSFLAGLGSFLTGFTILFWSVATWWIPLLVVLGVWRHLVRGIPFRYQPHYWGMVFPLGMYTACTFVTSRATGLSFLTVIPGVFLWIALAAWLAVFAGMLGEIGRKRTT